MTCMDLNLYLCGGLAASIVGNIFWFFKWCVAKGKLLDLQGLMGIEP